MPYPSAINRLPATALFASAVELLKPRPSQLPSLRPVIRYARSAAEGSAPPLKFTERRLLVRSNDAVPFSVSAFTALIDDGADPNAAASDECAPAMFN